MQEFHELQRHRSHDYRYLMRCWRELTREAGLKMKPLVKVNGIPVYFIASNAAEKGEGTAVYISAGVHGDEVAAPWGLLAWARENVALLNGRPFLLFPALNPHGMILNTRVDHAGRDINRLFHHEEDELIVAWRAVLQGWRFSLGLCLHEDYDGQGCYLYELTKSRRPVGHDILQDCNAVIPIDMRRSMDGHRANAGLIVRRRIPEMPGRPEAIVLHEVGTSIALTFETPSEFSLTDRIQAQKAFITSALKHAPAL